MRLAGSQAQDSEGVGPTAGKGRAVGIEGAFGRGGIAGWGYRQKYAAHWSDWFAYVQVSAINRYWH